jgi:hypothetical protein
MGEIKVWIKDSWMNLENSEKYGELFPIGLGSLSNNLKIPFS